MTYRGLSICPNLRLPWLTASFVSKPQSCCCKTGPINIAHTEEKKTEIKTDLGEPQFLKLKHELEND